MKPTEDMNKTPATADNAAAPPRWHSLLKLGTNRWTLIILTVVVLLHAVGLTCYAVWRKPTVELPHPEVTVGQFVIATDRPEPGELAELQFTLHVTFLADQETAGRSELDLRRFRVRQDLEQLLRRARATDFEDSRLVGLKRQLQAQVNQALGMRAVSDVIITDLKLRYAERPARS